MKVLGIETSCDETGVAIYDGQTGLLAHKLYSQIKLHQQFGGVVPELASRDHVRRILPLVREVMAEAGCTKHDLHAVAHTEGPGLVGALLVGAAFATGLAWAWKLPVVRVHHLEGHLLAPLLENPDIQMPFLALLVSGGHTMLIHCRALGDYQILGDTLDDAVGEAFDKTAKLLGLPYPGGPHLAELANKGNAEAIAFPRPMVDRPGLDFSFSGIKTFALGVVQKREALGVSDADIAASFQEAIVDTLVIKTRRALEQTGSRQLVIAGGVGANLNLRARMTELMKKAGGEIFYPRIEFCTDNGAMIALAGLHRLRAGFGSEAIHISAQARMAFS